MITDNEVGVETEKTKKEKTQKIDEKIGTALVHRGVLEQADVEKVLTRQRAGDSRLFGEIAVDIGVLTVRELIDFLRGD